MAKKYDIWICITVKEALVSSCAGLSRALCREETVEHSVYSCNFSDLTDSRLVQDPSRDQGNLVSSTDLLSCYSFSVTGMIRFISSRIPCVVLPKSKSGMRRLKSGRTKCVSCLSSFSMVVLLCSTRTVTAAGE